ncbi:hypothetical protein [Haloferula sp. A504]|uniref:hypothetical protein n=1 Tax=Haloferula sp. A504 TaxID=3373601 RepID=UPI0031C9E991|nr:hypothetical protein [Verrucomicrobiaceae bacterium E54]
MKIPLPARLGIGGALLLALASCNEDQTAEIEKLTKDLETTRQDLTRQEERTDWEQNKLAEARAEVSELKSQLRQAERDLREATRELERYRHKEEQALKAEAEEPDAKEQMEAARETVTAYRDFVVGISGDQVEGRGVLVSDGGKIWIHLDRRIVEDNTKLEITTPGGTKLTRFGAFEVARSQPLARLEVLDEGQKGIPAAEQAAEIGRSTPMLALGEGGTLVEGRAYGSSQAGNWGLDRKIGDCPPGSPVFHGETGTLVGLMVSVTPEEPTLWPSRFGRERETNKLVRLDEKVEWLAVPIGTFMKEARLLEQADQGTRLMHALAATQVGTGGVSYGVLPSGVSAEELLEQHKTDSSVKALRELGPWLEENAARLSKSDVQKRIDSVFEGIQRVAQRQSRELAGTRFSEAHAAAAARTLKWHEEATKELAKHLRQAE